MHFLTTRVNFSERQIEILRRFVRHYACTKMPVNTIFRLNQVGQGLNKGCQKPSYGALRLNFF